MRSLLIITISLVLLGKYLEWTTQRPQPDQLSAAFSAPAIIRNQVVRTSTRSYQQPVATTTVTNKTDTTKITVAIKPEKTPLNLTLPGHTYTDRFSQPTQQRALNWFKKHTPENQIIYKAELVFDEKEGSSIKGGKVNIKIPFG